MVALVSAVVAAGLCHPVPCQAAGDGLWLGKRVQDLRGRSSSWIAHLASYLVALVLCDHHGGERRSWLVIGLGSSAGVTLLFVLPPGPCRGAISASQWASGDIAGTHPAPQSAVSLPQRVTQGGCIAPLVPLAGEARGLLGGRDESVSSCEPCR